jgi:hypothetical protein
MCYRPREREILHHEADIGQTPIQQALAARDLAELAAQTRRIKAQLRPAFFLSDTKGIAAKHAVIMAIHRQIFAAI